VDLNRMTQTSSRILETGDGGNLGRKKVLRRKKLDASRKSDGSIRSKATSHAAESEAFGVLKRGSAAAGAGLSTQPFRSLPQRSGGASRAQCSTLIGTKYINFHGFTASKFRFSFPV